MQLYQSEIPTKLDKSSMKKSDWIKARTQELYDMLPQTTIEERNTYTAIRDEIIEINFSFFGYIAKNQYVTDPLATYEDKLHSAITNFCDKMWAKYKFCPPCTEGEDPTKIKRYRTDLSFTVFFKPRLSECIKRELNTIKYSLRRTVCMKAAAQLGKHWGQLTKDDIAKVQLSPQEMQTLEAVFSTQYDAPYDDDYLTEAKTAQQSSTSTYWLDTLYTDKYDNIEDLIVYEMISQESKLDDTYLLKMSEIYSIPFADLAKARPIGEAKLKRQLEESIYIKDAFEAESGYGDNSDIED